MRDRSSRFIDRHDIGSELAMAFLAIVYVAVGFASTNGTQINGRRHASSGRQYVRTMSLQMADDAQFDAVYAAIRRLVGLVGRPIAVVAGAAVSRMAPSDLPRVEDFYRSLGLVPSLHLPVNTGERLLREGVAFERLMEDMQDVLSDQGRTTVVELLTWALRLLGRADDL